MSLTKNTFLKFIHDNFSQLSIEDKEFKALYSTLKVWKDLHAKMCIVQALKNILQKKRYIENISFVCAWQYGERDNYTVEVSPRVKIGPGNYLNKEEETQLIEHEILAFSPILDYLSDLGENETVETIKSLGDIQLNNIDNKLNDILYENEEELMNQIYAYEKNLLEQNLAASSGVKNVRKI